MDDADGSTVPEHTRHPRNKNAGDRAPSSSRNLPPPYPGTAGPTLCSSPVPGQRHSRERMRLATRWYVDAEISRAVASNRSSSETITSEGWRNHFAVAGKPMPTIIVTPRTPTTQKSAARRLWPNTPHKGARKPRSLLGRTQAGSILARSCPLRSGTERPRREGHNDASHERRLQDVLM